MYTKIYDVLSQEAKEIRINVFVKEQGFEKEFDEVDDVAKHMVLFEEGVPVATCRIFYSQERNCYLIGRIAVCKEYRGKKYGAKILQCAEQEIQKLGGKAVELSAQCRATEFYKKQGYMDLDDIHMEEYCPHTWMKKKLDGNGE